MSSVEIDEKAVSKDISKPIIPQLLNISSTGTASQNIMPSAKLTSVKMQPNQENLPRINVGLKATEGLQWKEIESPIKEKREIKLRPKNPH